MRTKTLTIKVNSAECGCRFGRAKRSKRAYPEDNLVLHFTA